MTVFKTMDPDVIRQLIEGEPNVLEDAVKEDHEIYKKARCPKCFAKNCQKKTDAPKIIMSEEGPQVVSSPFNSDSVIAEGHAQCLECGTEFYPETGLIRDAGPFITSVQPAGSHLE
jgi:hypothetical protein